MTDHTADVGRLLELRRQVAALSRTLGERELDGRLLRLSIETELVQQGVTKTDADKRAKVDGRYLAHERETLQRTEHRDRVLAEAEATRLGVLFALEDKQIDGLDALKRVAGASGET